MNDISEMNVVIPANLYRDHDQDGYVFGEPEASEMTVSYHYGGGARVKIGNYFVLHLSPLHLFTAAQAILDIAKANGYYNGG